MQANPIPDFGDQPNTDFTGIADGDTAVYDQVNDIWIPGTPTSSGGDPFTIFPIWAEENGSIANNSREWSFGNGSTGNVNIVLPVEAELFAVSFDAENGAGDASMHVLLNDAIIHTTKQFTNQDFELLTTPISFGVGQALGYRTNIENGNLTDCRVCAWFRIPSSLLSNAVLNDLLDVDVTGITAGQFISYNGTQYVPVTIDKNTVGLGNVDNTADIDKIISNPTQAALDDKANTSDPVSTFTNDANYIDGSQVPNFETLTNLVKTGNDLVYTKEDGTQDTIDLSIYLDDTNLSRLTSGTVNAITGIATFERDDTSTFTVDFSGFLGTTQARIISGSLNGATGDLTLTRDDTTEIIINISNLNLNASNINAGTFADARIAESNVTQHQAALVLSESQITDLADYLENVVEDLTPALGGDLDVNTRSIVSSDADRVRLAGDILINGANQLRAFNVKGTGLDARLSIQGTSTADNPGVEFTNDNNANRVLMRMITRGTTGTALQFYTEPDGGSIQNYMTLEDDGRLTFQSGGSIDLGQGNLSFTTGQIDINNAGIRKSGSNLQFSNDNATWVDLNTLVNKLSSGDNISELLNDEGYITAADVSANETVTTLNKVGNDLIYINEDGTVQTIDLSVYLDDTNLSRLVNGTIDPITGIATFERDDTSTFTVDFSSLLDNQNADEVPFSSSTGLTSTDVESAIDEVNTKIGTDIIAALVNVAFTNIVNTFTQSQRIDTSGIATLEVESNDGDDAAIIFRSTGGAENLWMIGNDGFTGNLRISRSNGLASNLELQLNDTLLDVRTKRIVNVNNPVNAQDAATKDYVDGLVAPIPLDGLTDFADANNPKTSDGHYNIFWNNTSNEYELFREFEQVATRDTPLANQTTTLEEYLSTTVNFPVAGTYRIDLSWTSSINDISQDMEVQLEEDSTELFLYKLEQKDSAGTGINVPNTTGGTTNTGTNQRNVTSSFVIVNVPAPTTRTYNVNFRSTSTNDEPTMYNAALHLRRLKV